MRQDCKSARAPHLFGSKWACMKQVPTAAPSVGPRFFGQRSRRDITPCVCQSPAKESDFFGHGRGKTKTKSKKNHTLIKYKEKKHYLCSLNVRIDSLRACKSPEAASEKDFEGNILSILPCFFDKTGRKG